MIGGTGEIGQMGKVIGEKDQVEQLKTVSSDI